MRVTFRESLKRWKTPVWPLRYHTTGLLCVCETEGDLLSQYYGVAACTVLFYDHLLTLGDEVGREFSEHFSITR